LKKEMAVVLVSGGMDSCVTAAIAAEKNETAFLHINYGQKTHKRELKAFNDIADYYNVEKNKRLIINLDFFRKIGGSSLTDKKMKITTASLNNRSIPTSYVPFRNANLLSIAVSWAEVIGATKIFIGAVEEDSSAYPDCKDEFFKAYNKMITEGTKPTTMVKVMTPLINFSKKQIIDKAFQLNAPIHLSWSCYQNDDVACGICDSCALRLRGFQMADKKDPIPYAEVPEYI